MSIKNKVYELQEQLIRIDAILAENTDEETGEILEQAREQVLQEIGNNFEYVLDYIDDVKGKIEQIDNNIKRLQNRKKSIVNYVDFLKGLIFDQLKLQGIDKVEYGTWVVGTRKNTPKVVLDEASLRFLPYKYVKITYEPIKSLIKEDMTDGVFKVNVYGQDVEIAHLEQSESLVIK